jgi:hypothetical protein
LLDENLHDGCTAVVVLPDRAAVTPGAVQ